MGWKWQTIQKALAKWSFKPVAPMLDELMALGAALKMGNYASAESHVFFYRCGAGGARL